MDANSLTDWLRMLPVGGFAGIVGGLSALLGWWVVRRGLKDVDSPSETAAILWGLVTGGVVAGLVVAVLSFGCQETPEVRPSAFWWQMRPAVQAILIVLLAGVTATDLRTYYILDWMPFLGAVLAILFATVSGDLQLVHLWIDWTQEVPQLRGPYIPDWLAAHPHWHGFAWSMAGLLAGGTMTWLARWGSSILLGRESLGFGDVTLMAMIGAFVGWQPVTIVFLFAPLLAIVLGLPAQRVAGRSYLPYGPFLALAAVVVLFCWRKIWMFEVVIAAAPRPGERETTFVLRRLFGDGPGLAILAGLLAGGTIIMLGAWRLYAMIPVRSRAVSPPDSEE